MTNKINIAIDAMGGENSPKKVIAGIDISLKTNDEIFFYLYGQENFLKKELDKKKSLQKHCEIIHTEDIILDNESPLAAAKRGKESSMWKAIESQKENKSDISELFSFWDSTAIHILDFFFLAALRGLS